MTWHPWRYLREQQHITLTWRSDMPTDLLGYTRGNTIYLSASLLQDERRSTLTHELVHHARGDVACGERDEEIVRETAARLLIQIRPLGEALKWSLQLAEVAEQLWVDLDTLSARLRHLHPAERAYLKRMTEHHD